MNKDGLRVRVYVLTILPTLVIGILLAGYFTINRNQQLEDFVIEQGINVVEPLAIASEVSMQRHNRERVKHLISLTHKKNSLFVKSIAVFDQNNELFVTSNFHRNFEQLKLKTKLSELVTTDVEVDDEHIILRSPIFAEAALLDPLSDAAEQVLGYVVLQYSKDRTLLLFYRDTSVAILIVLVGLLVAAVLSLRLLKSVTQPVSDMVKVVDKIGRGRLDTRVEGEYSGEMEQLKNGINSMAMSLATYQEEMQQSIDQATSDLRETLEQIEIQNVELDIAKKSAQEAARVKSEFLANMSHELRTPLNGVIGFARQLQKTSLSPSQTDHVQTIERSANNLLTIINDILDFSKLEAGKLVLEKIPFSIRETVEEVMNLLAPSATDKQLELSLLIENQVPDSVIGDPLRVQQVLTNLTSNAIKFTERGDIHIHVWLEQQDGNDIQLKMAVTDTGVGINPDHQETLFQSFKQADTSITRRYGGTGLGLVITQKLVQQMGGEVLLNSTPGKGSTFLISIRLAISHTPVSQPGDIDRLDGQRILLLEQNERSRSSLKQAMEPWPIELVACRDPAQWERELRHDYDWVLLGHDASEPLSTLTARAESAVAHDQSLIIMLSSNDPTVGDQLLAKGTSACLSKPVSLRKLANALNHYYSPEQELAKIQIRPPQVKDGRTVMAVDDNPANLKLINSMLEEMVDNVEVCKNGQEAVDAAQKHKFDLIFMDIQMPVLDGISASQQIRTIALNKTTPIIAVTAHALPGEKEKLLEAGMDDYLSKPLDEHSLQQALAKWAVVPSEQAEALEQTALAPTKQPATKQPPTWQPLAQSSQNLTSGAVSISGLKPQKAGDNNAVKLTSAHQASASRKRLGAEVRPPLAELGTQQGQRQDGELGQAPELQSAPEQQSAVETVDPKVLDWGLALQRARNKDELAKQMLMMLLDSFDDMLHAQQSALNGEMDEATLVSAVHKFHGGCSYSGCPNLKNLASILEKGLKQGMKIEELEPELFELEEEIDKVQQAAKVYLA